MNEMGRAIVELEGRFDRQGNLKVYQLPEGDGGGDYEVAGINEKYHPVKAAELKFLIESGKPDEALEKAANYIMKYTDPVLKFFPEGYDEGCPSAEFILRDTAFNRGAKGAATVLQIALGMHDVDGIVGPKTRVEFGKQLLEVGCKEICLQLTEARKTYERNSYPWKMNARDESSKFWKGLSNRWTKSHQIALTRFA